MSRISPWGTPHGKATTSGTMTASAGSFSFCPLPGHIFVFKHKGVQGVAPPGQQGGEMVRATAGSGQVPGPGPGLAPGARTEAAREVLALRNLVAVYRHLSGLAVQNTDLAAVTRLISEQTDATVAVVSPTMDILTAAAPGQSGERAAQDVRDLVVHPRLGECSPPRAGPAGRCACPGRGPPPR
jgi:hypothetical protein